MTFKTEIKFDESPILRELEQVAIKRGMIEPAPLVKEAAVEESYASTGDLHEDVLLLVEGLRKKGFEREASDLEDKVNIHRIAETHLYRVIDEDGDDLLDFAHPEGDVEIAPSKSGLGKIWTEQSAKKEFLRVVNKKPTGKYSSIDSELKSALGLAKEAQSSKDLGDLVYDKWRAVLNRKNLVGYIGWWAEERAQDWVTGIPYQVASSAVELFEAQAASDLAKYMSDRQQKMKDTEGDLTDDLYGVAAGAWSMALNQAKAKSAPKEKPGIGYKQKPAGGKVDIGALIFSPFKGRKASLNRAIESAAVPEINRDLAGAMLDDMESIEKSVSGKKYLNHVASALSGSMQIPGKPINWAKVKRVSGLNYVVGVYLTYVDRVVSAATSTKPYKEASVNDDSILKEAVAPEIPDAPPAKTPGGQPAGGAGRGTVWDIQEELDRLAEALEATKATIDVSVLRNTGSPPDVKKPDGKWGGKTEEALEMAEKIRNYFTKPKGTKGVKGGQAVGGYTDAQLPPIVTNSPAQSNIAALRELTKAVIGQGSGKKQQGEVYDNINGHDLTSNDLRSAATFYRFLSDKVGAPVEISQQGEEAVKIDEFEGWISGLEGSANQKLAGAKDNKERRKYGSYIRALRGVRSSLEKAMSYAAKVYWKSILPSAPDTPQWTSDHIRAMNSMHARFLYMAAGGRGAPGERPGAGYRRRDRGGRGGSGEGREISFISGGSGMVDDRDVPPISSVLDLRDERWEMDEYNMWLDYKTVGRMTGVNFARTYFGAEDVDEFGEQRAFAKAQKFIRLLGGRMSRVLRDWEDDLENREIRAKLVPLSSRDASIWKRRLARWSAQLKRKMEGLRGEQGAPPRRAPARTRRDDIFRDRT